MTVLMMSDFGALGVFLKGRGKGTEPTEEEAGGSRFVSLHAVLCHRLE